MKNLNLFIILTTLSLQLFSQDLRWVKKQGGNSPDQTNGIATDKDGNIVAVGTFDGTASFGSINLTTSGNLDIFVAKYDSTGTCLWARKAGASFGDEGRGVAVDEEGNIYITGTYGQSGAIFDGIVLGSAGGLRNGFLAKYNANGSIIWAKTIGGLSSSPEPRKVVIGTDSKVYVAGEFYGTITFNGTQQITSSAGGANDIFTTQFDSSGTAIWANRGGNRKDEKLTGLTVDADGNPIICGSFDSLVSFGGSGIIYARDQGPIYGHTDLYVVKYTKSGGQSWFQHFGGTDGDFGGGICVDNSGNIYTTGYFRINFYSGSLTANNSGSANTLFLHKLDAAGNPLWVKFSPYPNSTGYQRGMDLAYANNEILLAGYFGGKYKAGNSTMQPGGENNPIIIKYDTSGTQLWGAFGNGVVGKVSQGLSVAISGKNYYYAGYIVGSVTFNDSTIVAPGTYTDGFICSVKDGAANPQVGNPTMLTVGSATTSSITLNWDGPSSEFRVLKKSNTSSTSATDGEVVYEGSQKTINLTGLTANFPYFITVYGKASGSATYSAGFKKIAATTVSNNPSEDVVVGFLAGDSIVRTFGSTGVKINISGASVSDGNIRVEVGTVLDSLGDLPINIDSIFDRLYWTITNTGLTGGALRYCITVDVTKVWDLVGFVNYHILKRPKTGMAWENLMANTSFTVVRNSPEITICGLSTFSEFAVGMADPLLAIEKIDQEQIIAFPNPASKLVSLDLSGTDVKTILLFDSYGKLVREIEVTSDKMQIEKEGLNNGLYFLKAGTLTHKLMFVD